jgi:hypothetical protein
VSDAKKPETKMQTICRLSDELHALKEQRTAERARRVEHANRPLIQRLGELAGYVRELEHAFAVLHAAVSVCKHAAVPKAYLEDHMSGWDIEMHGMPTKAQILAYALEVVDKPRAPLIFDR